MTKFILLSREPVEIMDASEAAQAKVEFLLSKYDGNIHRSRHHRIVDDQQLLGMNLKDWVSSRNHKETISFDLTFIAIMVWGSHGILVTLRSICLLQLLYFLILSSAQGEFIRISPVAYKLGLPDKLCGIHNTFHVSNLKKCLADENLVIPLEEIQLDDKLYFIEEPVEIMDREVKQLKQSQIPIVKGLRKIEVILAQIADGSVSCTWDCEEGRGRRGVGREANWETGESQFLREQYSFILGVYVGIRSEQSTRNRGKAIVTSSAPTYDPEPATVTKDEEMSKEKEIEKLMDLISLSGTGYDNQRAVNVDGPRENIEEAEVQLNAEQADLKDDTDDESDPVDNSGPIFDDEPMHKVQNNNDNYNMFAMENEHPEQPESSNDIYLAEHGDTNIPIDSLDICYDRDQDDQDDTDDLDQERDLLASLINKLKCEIDDSKNRNKFLESSNNYFKEANNELSKTNQLMFKDLKKFQAELDKYN
ncbi:hypothetical protein Tco_0370403 [Tanacetum coccineum]